MLLVISNISIYSKLVYIGIEMIVLSVILLMAPVQNINKPLTLKEKKVYTRKTICIWIIECCLMSVFVIYRQYTYSLIILFAHSIVIIAVLVGKIEEKMKKATN